MLRRGTPHLQNALVSLAPRALYSIPPYIGHLFKPTTLRSRPLPGVLQPQLRAPTHNAAIMPFPSTLPFRPSVPGKVPTPLASATQSAPEAPAGNFSVTDSDAVLTANPVNHSKFSLNDILADPVEAALKWFSVVNGTAILQKEKDQAYLAKICELEGKVAAAEKERHETKTVLENQAKQLKKQAEKSNDQGHMVTRLIKENSFLKKKVAQGAEDVEEEVQHRMKDLNIASSDQQEDGRAHKKPKGGKDAGATQHCQRFNFGTGFCEAGDDCPYIHVDMMKTKKGANAAH